LAEIRKVTDPAKIVTDPVLLTALTKQGVDKDYVELTQDYGKPVKSESSPYAKFYRDLKSDKRFMVISQLPMVDADGRVVEVGWNYEKGIYTTGNNLFSATVDGTQVTLTVRNNQPDGTKAGATLTTSPQLFLDGVEQKAGDALLLATDPVNSNYANNTLEWDYGICKRRVRVVEGRIHGYWIFTTNPGADVTIRYNQSGDFKLKLGQFKVSPDEEYIPASAFDSPEAKYPFVISDSATFYPDAHPETSSVDGRTWVVDKNTTWASLRNLSGDGAADNGTGERIGYRCGNTTGNFNDIYRFPYLIDTSGLPDDAAITAATFSVYGYNKTNGGASAPAFNIYSSNPASNTALVAGDYAIAKWGATAYSDNAISYTGWSTTGYNDFVFNSTGIAAISKTGITKLGMREANYDVTGTTPPSWVNAAWEVVFGYFAEQGTGYKPKLVVTYTPAATAKTSSETGSGAESLGSRLLGAAEAGSALEATILMAAAIADDSGLGLEIGGLLKTIYDGDWGVGLDALKALVGAEDSGSDMRLYDRPGQAKIPSKGVNYEFIGDDSHRQERFAR
jgi:hypothetical protein